MSKAQPDQFGDLIDINKIEIPDRLRALDPEKVDALAESMAHQGQLHPIVTRAVEGGSEFQLVIGLHRLKAAMKLGWTQIRATAHAKMSDDEADLAEIDENLCRAELSEAEETLHLKRRKEIYERLHPETKHGATGRRGKSARSEHSFVDDTAEKTGKGASTIRKKITRGKRTDDKALQDAAHTSLDNAGELEALSKKSKAEQRRLATAAKAGEKVSAKSAERPIEQVKAAAAALVDEAPVTKDDGSIPTFLDRRNEAPPPASTNGANGARCSLAQKLHDILTDLQSLCQEMPPLSGDNKRALRSAMKKLDELRGLLPRLAQGGFPTGLH